MTPDIAVRHGDCLDVMADLPDESVHAVVTDPPYDLTAGKRGGTGVASINLDSPYGRSRISTGNGAGGFMGQAWDGTGVAFDADTWRLVLRVLKPGGHLLAFGGSRTYHRLACAVEDAGFDIRDSIAWLYGAGFPKSLDVSKAIDKAAGAEREPVGRDPNWRARVHSDSTYDGGQVRPEFLTAPATEDAERWQGWGTALKPAHEPIVVARKPLAGTVAANVAEHGTGALNIDGCRVGTPEDKKHPGTKKYGRFDPGSPEKERQVVPPYTSGRWPANVVLDEHTAALLDEQSGVLTSGANPTRRGSDKFRDAYGDFQGQEECVAHRGTDSGGASRFFYVSKAAADERIRHDGTAHPTVKPLDLMRWLVRLVTPPGGTVLDPFAGSGTTAEACLLEGFDCIAVEREADYLPLIQQRLNRRRDPVAYTRTAGSDGGLFDLLEVPADD